MPPQLLLHYLDDRLEGIRHWRSCSPREMQHIVPIIFTLVMLERYHLLNSFCCSLLFGSLGFGTADWPLPSTSCCTLEVWPVLLSWGVQKNCGYSFPGDSLCFEVWITLTNKIRAHQQLSASISTCFHGLTNCLGVLSYAAILALVPNSH